jgi:hypothetical protein
MLMSSHSSPRTQVWAPEGPTPAFRQEEGKWECFSGQSVNGAVTRTLLQAAPALKSAIYQKPLSFWGRSLTSAPDLDSQSGSYPQPCFKMQSTQVLEADACHPCYSGGRDQEDHGSKPAQANSSGDPIWKLHLARTHTHTHTHTHKELVEWLKVKALSLKSSTTQKKCSLIELPLMHSGTWASNCHMFSVGTRRCRSTWKSPLCLSAY